MIVSNIFQIVENLHPWEDFNWTVTWDGHGSIHSHSRNALTKIWESAYKDTGAWTVGFCFANRKSARIDSIIYETRGGFEHLVDSVKDNGPLFGVMFKFKDEAEVFAEAMEKHVIWHLLKANYDQEVDEEDE